MFLINKILPKVTFNSLLNLFSYLGEIKYFLQIGSHDGSMHDPLQNFILKNKSSGLLVEPQLKMLNKCKTKYQKIQNLRYLNAAISSEKKEIKLYKVDKALDYSHTGWASIKADRFENTIYEKNHSFQFVQGIPLDDVIINFDIKKIDLLQIDTEGYDFEILKIFNFKLFDPKIIQLEHAHLKKDETRDAISLLSKNNYFVLKKKNDLVCLKKKFVTPIFFIAYFFLRITESLKSRFYNFYEG